MRKKTVFQLVILQLLAFLAVPSFAQDSLFAYKTTETMTIDGYANEAAWANATWYPIDQLWMFAMPSPSDFTGRYKITWDKNYLYVLAEITDDSLSDKHADPFIQYWDDDCFEIFLDGNRLQKNHEGNYNAWAHHLSITGDNIDEGPHNYREQVEMHINRVGNVYTWECKLTVYGEDYQYLGNNTPLTFYNGKKMGFAAAYCDNDGGENRESFMGSAVIPGPDKNQCYKTSLYFQLLTLLEDNGPHILSNITVSAPKNNIITGESIQFTATGIDQNGMKMNITPSWSASGGTISAAGMFTSSTEGTYKIMASVDSVTGSSSISVADTIRIPVPGKLEAENYFTMNGIKTETTTDIGNGQNVGFCEGGDWLDYNIKASATGKYLVDFRVANGLTSQGQFQLVQNNTVLCTINVKPTNGWQTWNTIRDSITLKAGKQPLRIKIITAGVNINWLQFTKTPETPTVIFSTPADDAIVEEGTNLVVKITALSNDTISSVSLYINNTLVRDDLTPPYEWGQPSQNDVRLASLKTGSYKLKAVAKGMYGGTKADSITLTVKKTTITQNIMISKGWNLISLSVVPTFNKIDSIFSPYLDHILEIKNFDSFWSPGQASELNSMTTIDVGKGYILKSDTTMMLKVNGKLLTIYNPQISVKAGWNLVGYPFQEKTAFSDHFTTQNCVIIKDFDGFWMPDGTVNSIDTFEQGKGYFVKGK